VTYAGAVLFWLALLVVTGIGVAWSTRGKGRGNLHGDVGWRRALAAAAAALAVGVAVSAVSGIGGSSRRHRPAAVTSLPPAKALPPLSPSAPGLSAPPTSRTAPARAPVGPAALPFPSVERFGTGVQGIFLNYSKYTPPQIRSQLRALRLTGSTIARSDALWEAAEPNPPVDGKHDYNWQFDDLTVGTLAASGLRWLPIVDYSPLWAASAPGQAHSPPRAAADADFASFAAALAERYGPGGAFWRGRPGLAAEPVDTYEIWNEPDNALFWGPAPDAGRYVELYLRARAAVKAVDPGARVIVGGLTAPNSFLPAMLAARPDLRGHVDGVAIHPWGPNPVAVRRNLRTARAKMRLLGMGSVPIYVTAFGWTTSPPGAFSYLPAHLRPGFIADTMGALGHTDCGIAAVILDTWVTPERNRLDGDDWFGIERPSGGLSPDAAAFAAGLHTAEQHRPQLRLCRPS
jgi:hypothetical protein